MSTEAILTTILITIITAPIVWFISWKLDQYFKVRRNQEIAKEYLQGLAIKDGAISEREKRIIELESQKEKEAGEKRQIIEALRRSGISTTRLIERYDKPLNAILISYDYQTPAAFIKDELLRYNSKWLGGDVSLIPPSSVPKGIKDRDDLKSWFESEILKDRRCKLKFLILVDLKAKAYWNTYLPNSNVEHIHRSIGEQLDIEDLFTPEQMRLIALKDIVQSGDIVWLCSRVLSAEELQVVHSNQDNIEEMLGKPTLRELADSSVTGKLASVLGQYVKKPEDVAKAITEEARFWQSVLK